MHSLAAGFECRSHDGKNIGRFYRRSLARYFSPDSGLVYDSGTPPKWPRPRFTHLRVNGRRPRGLKPYSLRRVRPVYRSDPMPYALFSNEAKLSKAYPPEADVWRHARLTGL